jgi:hypothetical protein
MEDRDYQTVQDAVNGRLATSTLRFFARWQAGRTVRTERDVERLRWLHELLVQSLGGARRLYMQPQKLAPEIEPTHGPPRQEIASYHRVRRYSGADSPEEHSAWVQDTIKTLDRLATNGAWATLSEKDKTRVASLKPLLEWLAGASDRGAREPQSPQPLVGA